MVSVVLGILALINIIALVYIFKELKRKEKIFAYDINSLQLYISHLDESIDTYQRLYQDYINEINKYIAYHQDAERNYRTHVSKIIKDIPKEIVVKNVLSI